MSRKVTKTNLDINITISKITTYHNLVPCRVLS